MTAIPEPTEEDLTVLSKISEAYEEIQEEIRLCDDYYDGDRLCDLRYEERLIRLLSHYQRENERLARHIGRTADGICLIDCKEFYCPSCGSLLKSVSNGTWQSCRRCRKHWSRSEAMSKPNDFIDALSGEGGVA